MRDATPAVLAQQFEELLTQLHELARDAYLLLAARDQSRRAATVIESHAHAAASLRTIRKALTDAQQH